MHKKANRNASTEAEFERSHRMGHEWREGERVTREGRAPRLEANNFYKGPKNRDTSPDMNRFAQANDLRKCGISES
jgi:hypothetical protein